MCFQPKDSRRSARIYTCLSPPGRFITAAMDLAVMSPAQRNRKLVADLPAKRRRLGKAQMVSIGGPTTTDQTRLLGNGFNVLPVANATRQR